MYPILPLTLFLFLYMTYKDGRSSLISIYFFLKKKYPNLLNKMRRFIHNRERNITKLYIKVIHYDDLIG